MPESSESQKATEQDPPSVTLFVCGDVMTGRGIDQILPTPSDPQLFEPVAHSALEYVRLAERRNGRIGRPGSFGYVWGDALGELQRRRPDARIVNLETAVTTSQDAWADKGIHYRMHPQNVPCLTAAGIDCCVLAMKSCNISRNRGKHNAGSRSIAAALRATRFHVSSMVASGGDASGSR